MSYESPFKPIPLMPREEPAPQRKVKVFFLDNTWAEYDAPPEFDLTQYMIVARATGYVQTKDTYFPLSVVKLIMVVTGGTIQGGAVTVDMKLPNAPTSETKQ